MIKADTKPRSLPLRLTRSGDEAMAFRPSPGPAERDPAHEYLTEILRLVPADRWRFARITAGGELETFERDPSANEARETLAAEFAQQRAARPGSRIAPARRPIAGFPTGIVLLFADARNYHGILTLHRSGAKPFTSSEINLLTFALDILSERLAALQIHPRRFGAPTERAGQDAASEAPDGAFYVLDGDLRIMLAWKPGDEGRSAELDTLAAERLPAVIERTVRELTAGWSANDGNARAQARPVSFLTVRTHLMSGPAGRFIGVRIDRCQAQNSLIGAAARYHISPREVQVLTLLLDGNHLHQIADELNITPSTVQDHIKSMLNKTRSGNRSELIARVLGWESAPRDGLAS